MVSSFAQATIAPKVAKMDEDGALDPLLLQQLFNQGLMGIETPLEYEGGGMTFTQSCIVIEELAKVDPAISVIVDIQNTLINTSIMKYGSEHLKKKWLPRLATDTLASFCLSEAGSGSDAFAMKSTATQVAPGEWSINGTKMWISNAKEAGLFMIFVNAAPEKGYKGITCFLVPAGTKGLTVGKKENKLGIRASSTCELSFDDLRVKEDQILGKFGEGYKIAIGSLNEGRIGIGAQMLGLAQGAFDSAMPYLHQRKQFGQALAEFQMIQASMAQCAMEIECARLLVYNAARLKESNQPFIQQAAMAKLKSSLVAEKVASQAVEWMGGLGFTKDYPLEKYYRDAKIGSIYEGTTNLQQVTIAKLISKQYS
jgi:short/branched chain acyl-CoA dehydrogenase